MGGALVCGYQAPTSWDALLKHQGSRNPVCLFQVGTRIWGNREAASPKPRVVLALTAES